GRGEGKEKGVAARDGDLAKSMGELESLESLRAEVTRQLESRQQAEDRHALEDKVVDALLGRHQFGVPDSLVMRQIAMQVEHARDRMRRQGVDPDGITWDYTKLVAELRPGAERAVRRALLVDAIAEREGLTPTDA